MPIIAKDTTQTWESPTEGLHQAVCCDVVDLGELDIPPWGPSHKVQLRWQIDELTTEGKPMLISRRFTLSLHEKSTLRPFLEAWRGKRFGPEDLAGFDLERLIGVNCQLQVIYNEKDGRTYANVQTAIPLAKGTAKMAVYDYIRVQDKAAENGNSASEEDPSW